MDTDQQRLGHVDFLIKAANLLPTENHAHKLLKSYYLTKCKKLMQSDQNLVKTHLNNEEMCRKCSIPWTDASYSLSIAPIKVTKRKALKLQKQIDHKSKRKNPLVKKFSKKSNNIITIECGLCKSKNRAILYKKAITDDKQYKLENNIVQQKSIEPSPMQSASRKKKRKKDKTAGLSYTLNKDDSKTTKKIINLCQQTQTLNIQKKLNISTQHNKIQNEPENQSKSKSNSAKASKKTKNILQSIPKRTNILLLANALKAKSSQSSSNSNVDKRKQMLR